LSWDCAECVKLGLVQTRRCYGGPGKFQHATKQGDLFDKCPKSWLHSDASGELALYSDYRWFADHATLPTAGGKLDQDPQFVEAVGIIEAVIAELRAKSSG